VRGHTLVLMLELLDFHELVCLAADLLGDYALGQRAIQGGLGHGREAG